jgi:predicted HTH transcriptional regulator
VAEPALHLGKLLELLELQHESPRLDFKRTIDLSEKRHELELVKDIAAFQAEGGYLIIGVDERGAPTRELTEQNAVLLDESRLRAKSLRYLTEPLDLRTAAHVVDGAHVVLIYF